jgi:hypothetical protein
MITRRVPSTGGAFQPAADVDVTGDWTFTPGPTMTSPTLITPDLGVASATSLTITGTDGAGYLTLPAQAVQPPAPTAGTTLVHAFTTGGFTRLEHDNEAPTNVTIGRDAIFIAINNTGVTITKGALVNCDTGVTNDIPSIVLADDGSLTKFPVAGMVVDDIDAGAFGQVMMIGILAGLDGHGFTPGFPLYLHPTTPGDVTDTRPVAPSLAQRVGVVLDGDSVNGAFLVHVGPFVGGLETGTTAPRWVGSGTVATAGYTVAGLPAGTLGDRAHVSDALGPVFGSAVVGGGAVAIPVFKNATAWIVG